jgi:hypothetical protein
VCLLDRGPRLGPQRKVEEQDGRREGGREGGREVKGSKGVLLPRAAGVPPARDAVIQALSQSFSCALVTEQHVDLITHAQCLPYFSTVTAFFEDSRSAWPWLAATLAISCRSHSEKGWISTI